MPDQKPDQPSDGGAEPSLQSFAGRYAFRFNGFSMGQNVMPYYIVGLGTFVVDDTGDVTGALKSSITQLAGSQSKMLHSEFSLVGTFSLKTGGAGDASILFKSPDEEMRGEFDLVAAGPDRFWLISSGGNLMPSFTITDEVVSGEAIKLA